jgi:hypothetical protein
MDTRGFWRYRVRTRYSHLNVMKVSSQAAAFLCERGSRNLPAYRLDADRVGKAAVRTQVVVTHSVDLGESAWPQPPAISSPGTHLVKDHRETTDGQWLLGRPACIGQHADGPTRCGALQTKAHPARRPEVATELLRRHQPLRPDPH